MGWIPIRFLRTKLQVDHFPLSELSMDNLPSEIKLHIINFLPLESVKLVMSLNKDLWNLCHSSSHWKNVKLVIDSWNVKTVLANNMLSQCRFSTIHSVKAHTVYISAELSDELIRAIASSKVTRLELCGRYHGSWKLLRTINVVDTTSLIRIIRR